MKRVAILILLLLVVACADPLPMATPTSTPDEGVVLKAYLEEARALIDHEKEASDALAQEIDLPDVEDHSIEGRKAWQELAIRQRPILLEFQSQWEALNPPPMAQGYHAQMSLVIGKELEQWLAIEMAPVGSEDAFFEVFLEAYDLMLEALFLQAEAEKKFDTLWEIATEEKQ